MIRSVESLGISVLRLVHEEAIKERTARVTAEVPLEVATYLMNEKRNALIEVESRCGVNIMLVPNAYLDTPYFKIERIREDQLPEHPKASYAAAEAKETPPPMPTVAPRPAAPPAVSALRPASPPPKAQRRTGLFGRFLAALGLAPGKIRTEKSAKPGDSRQSTRSSQGRRTARKPEGRQPTAGRRSHGGRRTDGQQRRRDKARSSPRARPTATGTVTETGEPRTSDAPQRAQRADSTSGGENGRVSRPRTRRGRRGGRRRRGRGGSSGPGPGAGPQARREQPETPESDGLRRAPDAPPPAPEINDQPLTRPPATQEAAKTADAEALTTPRLAALYEREQTAATEEGVTEAGAEDREG